MQTSTYARTHPAIALTIALTWHVEAGYDRAVNWSGLALTLLPSNDDLLVAHTCARLYSRHDATALRALATRADKRPALLLRTELVVAAEAAGQSETLIGLWRQFALQDRPNFRTKLRAFLAQLRRFE